MQLCKVVRSNFFVVILLFDLVHRVCCNPFGSLDTTLGFKSVRHLVLDEQDEEEEAFTKYERYVHGDALETNLETENELVRVSVDLNSRKQSFIDQFQPPTSPNGDGDRRMQQVDPSMLRSTGTTIAGICGRDFVVLGADTRATNGQMVADKRCEKIHELADNVYACGAGTSADLQHLTRQVLFGNKVRSAIKATIGNTDCKGEPSNIQSVARVCEEIQLTLFRQGGQCSANLVVGGVYKSRAILRAIHPHGSQDALAFTALGSGGLAAMCVLEQSYHENMTVEEAKALVTRAIRAGITNDLGSGSQVDLCVITSKLTESIRCHVPEDEVLRIQRPLPRIEASVPGVNGFGNHPFSLRKVRTLVATSSALQSLQADAWKSILSSRNYNNDQ